MKKGILGRIAENKEKNAQRTDISNETQNLNDEFMSFQFEGKKYYIAVRENILVFDSNMLLIHTLQQADVFTSEVPLIQKVAEILSYSKGPSVRLYVKRNGIFEKLSFHNLFDAIFIFKKLKRVASRPDENIEEIYIEENDKMIEHFIVNQIPRRFSRRLFRRKSESENVLKLTNIEDALEDIISENVNNPNQEIDKEKVDKCIELLQNLK